MRGRPESLRYFELVITSEVKSREDWVIRRKPLLTDLARGSSETIRVGTETSKI